MPVFNIECEHSLGMSHCGEVIAEGEGTVELTDEDVKVLVDLIREKGTTDVDELHLKDTHPELYAKLDEAYHDMTYDAEEMHWLWEGWNNGYFEYDVDELLPYCEAECGFVYEPSEDVVTDEDDENYDEEALEEDKEMVFQEWLDEYVACLSVDEARDFFYDHLGADLNMEDLSYEVGIPADIIQMAKM